MTITDPAHVATAKVLREQFRQPRTTPASLEDGLARDLVDYDRAFGIADGFTDPVGAAGDGRDA